MNIEIYHAEHADIPFLIEQAEEFSKFADYKKKQLYPGDEYAETTFKTFIDKQVIFMAKHLKPGYAYNEMLDQVGKMEKDGNGNAFMISTELAGDEDPWIRTGFIAGFLYPHFFNPEIMTLMEVFWWVAEPYRQSRAGLKLFNQFLEFGKDRADQVIFTLEDNSPVKGSFLTKKGFRVKEHSFVLEV